MYIGRFAPSPTGSLHLGSLLAAVGSFLNARSRGGRWLERMEDLDRARLVPGSADEILRTLEAFGLYWDGEVEYQSRRTDCYAAALTTLRTAGHTFECSCSRRELTTEGEPTEEASARAGTRGPAALPPGVSRGSDERADRSPPRASAEQGPRSGMAIGTSYPGTCRTGPRRPGDTATRFRIDETVTAVFEDRFQGSIALALDKLGDVIVRRRDGIFAYQLAVVVDDARQGITDVVRGADLLESTGWQIALQRALRLPTPRYAHLPLLLERSGEKLSKSRRSTALAAEPAGAELLNVLRLLGLDPPVPPADLAGTVPAAMLEWATRRWPDTPAPLVRQLVVP